MKIAITKLQYDLIQEVLENYYYICKDGLDKNKMRGIIELEEFLSEQMEQK